MVSTSAVLNNIKPKLLAEYELEWQEKLNSDVAMRGIMPVVISSELIEDVSIHILQNHMLKLLRQRNIFLHMLSLDVE